MRRARQSVSGVVSYILSPYLSGVMGSLPSLSPQRTRSPAPPVRGFFFLGRGPAQFSSQSV